MFSVVNQLAVALGAALATNRTLVFAVQGDLTWAFAPRPQCRDRHGGYQPWTCLFQPTSLLLSTWF